MDTVETRKVTVTENMAGSVTIDSLLGREESYCPVTISESQLSEYLKKTRVMYEQFVATLKKQLNAFRLRMPTENIYKCLSAKAMLALGIYLNVKQHNGWDVDDIDPTILLGDYCDYDLQSNHAMDTFFNITGRQLDRVISYYYESLDEDMSMLDADNMLALLFYRTRVLID